MKAQRKRRKLLPIAIGAACCVFAGAVCCAFFALGFGLPGLSDTSSSVQARDAFVDVSDRQEVSEESGVEGLDVVSSGEELAITTNADGVSYVSNQLLASVEAGIEPDALSEKLSQAGVAGAKVSPVCTLSNGSVTLMAVTYSSNQDPVELSERLSAEGIALSVEPNYIASLFEEDGVAADAGDIEAAADAKASETELTSTSINDTNAGKQWQLSAINAYDAWDIARVNGAVTVAVLDSGVDYDHEDLKDNLILGDFAANVVDDGKGGFKIGSTGDAAVDDTIGHGTHVSGIITATTNNDKGVSGVSYNAKVLPVKVTDATSFSSARIVVGIEYVISLKQSDTAPDYIKNIKVINLSLGLPGTSDNLAKAVHDAENAGITVVAATGNYKQTDNYSGGIECPASVDTVIGVGSVARSSSGYSLSSFSKYGSGINVVAPGSSIWSTTYNGSYGTMNGTSMATPVVSGMAALLYAANPNLTTSQMRDAIEDTATDLGSAGWDDHYGSGLVNAEAAVMAAKGEVVNSASFDLSGISNPGTTMYIDGVAHEMSISKTTGTLVLADSKATVATLYTYNKTSGDTHEIYPTNMYVWLLEGQEGKPYTVTRMSCFDDLLRYAGTSIRLSGNKGIRMITSLPTSVKNALAGSGYEGWQLEEYGTAIQFDETLNGSDVLLTNTTYKNYAYKRGVADPVYGESDGRTQYTNVLVGFNDSQCGKDLSMRPYIILSNISSGKNITIYGGTAHRSIGYVALQNREKYPESTDAGQYIWGLIRLVYGNTYG